MAKQPPHRSQPPAPRKRAPVSCDRCKIRRSRCIRKSRDEACEDCQSNNVACENTLPRKQRVYGSIETLSLRYRALEALLKGLFPDDNIRDLDTLYKIADARNIEMPARDDFTPADIFSGKRGAAQEQKDAVPGLVAEVSVSSESSLDSSSTPVSMGREEATKAA